MDFKPQTKPLTNQQIKEVSIKYLRYVAKKIAMIIKLSLNA